MLQRHWNAVAPHLHRLLERASLLGTHADAFFEELPALLPYLGTLLDELPHLQRHIDGIAEHRATLVPAVRHLAPHLRYLRPYYGHLASRGATLAPHAAQIAPHIGELLPPPPFWGTRRPTLVHPSQLSLAAAKLNAAHASSELGPHDSLSNLSARASVIHSERGESEIGPDDSISNVGVGSRLAGGAGAGGTSRSEAAASTVGGGGDGGVDLTHFGFLLAELERGGLEETESGRDSCEEEEAPPPGAEAAEASGDLWSSLKRGWGGLFKPAAGEPVAVAPAARTSRRGGGPAQRRGRAQVLREVGEAIDEAEGRMRRLEGRFRVFKHDMHWRQQREEAAALQLCRMEGALFDAEDAAMLLETASHDLRREIERQTILIGPEAIARGRDRRIVARGSRPPGAALAEPPAQQDGFLWRLPL
ncbi:hypothetical protein EMIHUDRAFT_350284 [Emiliania huxleyi CCMP1516]|uniref:Uncharacterized protein n=2 Tax=Emiliania huxleyi TaxID=2903 RepID=A0A0D3IU02_EMIH1|nr:hypothetical protein EMIHUDRAFT_350284 [Emiliania huxleyi CCMP1516]EOD14737.1 hypothetical protein EMIHUDRAFT_350284 [Emiliania huxleyi CCMP1516]|eukprot:XP_005767166.1 hypothetical protein EMIHUDRAFT_350284 [Emiliania huxleyi CCMP1516]